MSHIVGQQREIYKLAVGMYAAAPGTRYFDELNDALEAGMSIAAVYRALAHSPSFQLQDFGFRSNASNAHFTNAFLDRLLGTEVSTSNRSFAFSFVFDKLQAGISRGDVMKIAIDALDAVPLTDPDFGAAALRLDNRIAVAQNFTEVLRGSSENIAFLQSTIAGVTSDVATRDSALAWTVPPSFVLTPVHDGPPAFTGGPGNDFFFAPVLFGTGGPQQALNTLDALDGGDGRDILMATIEDESVIPHLERIEDVALSFTGFQEVNLSQSNGVRRVFVENGSDVGTVSGLGAVDTLVVRNQQKNVVFQGSLAQALSVTLEQFGKHEALSEIFLGADASVQARTIALALRDAHAVIKAASVVPLESITIDASGSNSIMFGGPQNVVEGLTVTGSGSLDLSKSTLAHLTTLDAAGLTGALKVSLTDLATSLIAGSGADHIIYIANIADDAEIDLGRGDDVLVLGGPAGKNVAVQGGLGSDTLKVVDGDWIALDASTVYAGFEVLEIGGGEGTYSMSGLAGVIAVAISESSPTGEIGIVNAAPGTALTFTAKSSQNLTVSQDLVFELASSSGTADALELSLNAVDGNGDGAVSGLVRLFPDGSSTAKLAIPGIEIVHIASNILKTDSSRSAGEYENVFKALSGDVLESVSVSGNARLALSFAADTKTITNIDASAGSGIDVSVRDQTQSVEFIGSSASDVYTASAFGDTINAGKGADQVSLVVGTAGTGGVDRLVFAAGDSSLTGSGAKGHDLIVGFNGQATGGDLIDLGAFGFSAAAKAALAQKGLLNASAVNGTTLVQPNWFVTDGELRAVAVGEQINTGSIGPVLPGGAALWTTYVYVDVNKSGHFEASADLFIELGGVRGLELGNFVF